MLSQKTAWLIWLIETTVLAFIFYSCIPSCVSNCVAEMTSYTQPREASSATLIAAEVRHPRTYVKKAFYTIYFRFGFFFILGAIGSSLPGSPFIIAMRNLGVSVLPHLMSGLLVMTILSAGNTYMYMYCATRSLYVRAVPGRPSSSDPSIMHRAGCPDLLGLLRDRRWELRRVTKTL